MEKNCDFTFKLNNGLQVKEHTHVLSERMPYFCGTSTRSFTKGKSGEVPVQDLPGTFLVNILSNVYTYKP